jgi:hypothetical protein
LHGVRGEVISLMDLSELAAARGRLFGAHETGAPA